MEVFGALVLVVVLPVVVVVVVVDVAKKYDRIVTLWRMSRGRRKEDLQLQQTHVVIVLCLIAKRKKRSHTFSTGNGSSLFDVTNRVPIHEGTGASVREKVFEKQDQVCACDEHPGSEPKPNSIDGSWMPFLPIWILATEG